MFGRCRISTNTNTKSPGSHWTVPLTCTTNGVIRPAGWNVTSSCSCVCAGGGGCLRRSRSRPRNSLMPTRGRCGPRRGRCDRMLRCTTPALRDPDAGIRSRPCTTSSTKPRARKSGNPRFGVFARAGSMSDRTESCDPAGPAPRVTAVAGAREARRHERNQLADYGGYRDAVTEPANSRAHSATPTSPGERAEQVLGAAEDPAAHRARPLIRRRGFRRAMLSQGGAARRARFARRAWDGIAARSPCSTG